MANIPISHSKNYISLHKIALATYEQFLQKQWKKVRKEGFQTKFHSLIDVRLRERNFFSLNLSYFLCNMGAIVAGVNRDCEGLFHSLLYKLPSSMQGSIFPPDSQFMSIYFGFLICVKLIVDLTLRSRNCHQVVMTIALNLNWQIFAFCQFPS